MVFGFSDIFTVMEGERMFVYQTRRHVVSFFFLSRGASRAQGGTPSSSPTNSKFKRNEGAA